MMFDSDGDAIVCDACMFASEYNDKSIIHVSAGEVRFWNDGKVVAAGEYEQWFLCDEHIKFVHGVCQSFTVMFKRAEKGTRIN